MCLFLLNDTSNLMGNFEPSKRVCKNMKVYTRKQEDDYIAGSNCSTLTMWLLMYCQNFDH